MLIANNGGGETCTDTDNGATDRDDDGCDAYARRPAWCGHYNDDDFQADQMCCACGGGKTEGSK